MTVTSGVYSIKRISEDLRKSKIYIEFNSLLKSGFKKGKTEVSR